MKYWLLLVVAILSACAIATGSGPATVKVDRYLEVESTIDTTNTKNPRKSP